MKANVGYNLEFKPKDACCDEKGPFHGSIAVRGKIFEGTVVSDSMDKTVKVEWDNLVLDPKYSRYLKTKSAVLAHNPDCIKAKKGDKVKVGETRPISKRKHFAILEVVEE